MIKKTLALTLAALLSTPLLAQPREVMQPSDVRGGVQEHFFDHAASQLAYNWSEEETATANSIPETIEEHLDHIPSSAKSEMFSWLTELRSTFDASINRIRYMNEPIEREYAVLNWPSALGKSLMLSESNAFIYAGSHKGARSFWQFIDETGKRYGLSNVADFYDIDRSTQAHRLFLEALSDKFYIGGDVPLVLAGYNAGPGHVYDVRGNSRKSFWDLEANFFRETRKYVPRIIGGVELMRNPWAYGVELPNDPVIVNDIELEHPVEPGALSACLGADEARLFWNLNPRPKQGDWLQTGESITVPKQYAQRVIDECLGSERLFTMGLLAQSRFPFGPSIEYTVRGGDTLGKIAQQHGSSISAIKSANGLRNDTIIAGHTLIVPYALD